MKYLVVKCRELCDGFECDADREPICVTDDISKFGKNYEVYEINEDGSLNKIKDYDDALEEGMALYYWESDEDCETTKPIILEKYPHKGRRDFSKKWLEKLKKRVGFTCVDDIVDEIEGCGAYGEVIEDGKYEGKYVVFGEYSDDWFSAGY